MKSIIPAACTLTHLLQDRGASMPFVTHWPCRLYFNIFILFNVQIWLPNLRDVIHSFRSKQSWIFSYYCVIDLVCIFTQCFELNWSFAPLVSIPGFCLSVCEWVCLPLEFSIACRLQTKALCVESSAKNPFTSMVFLLRRSIHL